MDPTLDDHIFFYYRFIKQWQIGGAGWWFGILVVILSNNPLNEGILGIQTTKASRATETEKVWMEPQKYADQTPETPKGDMI